MLDCVFHIVSHVQNIVIFAAIDIELMSDLARTYLEIIPQNRGVHRYFLQISHPIRERGLYLDLNSQIRNKEFHSKLTLNQEMLTGVVSSAWVMEKLKVG